MSFWSPKIFQARFLPETSCTKNLVKVWWRWKMFFTISLEKLRQVSLIWLCRPGTKHVEVMECQKTLQLVIRFWKVTTIISLNFFPGPSRHFWVFCLRFFSKKLFKVQTSSSFHFLSVRSFFTCWSPVIDWKVRWFSGNFSQSQKMQRNLNCKKNPTIFLPVWQMFK